MVTARAGVGSAWISDAGIDFTLLTCALFLQRFSLSFGNSLMSLDIVPAGFTIRKSFSGGGCTASCVNLRVDVVIYQITRGLPYPRVAGEHRRSS